MEDINKYEDRSMQVIIFRHDLWSNYTLTVDFSINSPYTSTEYLEQEASSRLTVVTVIPAEALSPLAEDTAPTNLATTQ